MFGISTAWNAQNHSDARSMVEEIKKLGVDYIELNFKLSKETVNDVGKLVDEGFIKVISLHNFCPVPDSIDIKDASPDYYSLASIEKEERKKAVEETKHTIDTACRLKAQAVVVHSGGLNRNDGTRNLANAIEEGADAASIREAMQKEREEELKKGYLDCLLKSIEGISAYSKNCGVKIGLENRFYFEELPSIEEFEVIFDNFPVGANIYYWHDTGHAQVFENLGVTPHKDYLESFSSRLIGAHLHDIKDTIRDHSAPLTGDIDFTILKPYLHKGVIKILEPHPPASFDEVKRGLEYLKDLYSETG